MQDWDRLVMLLVGVGVAGYTGYAGWRAWQERQKGEAIGAFLLAAATVALPVALALLGG